MKDRWGNQSPDCISFLLWDKWLQAFYVQESNGRTFDYVAGEFQTPDFLPDPERFPVSHVAAVIYFQTTGTLATGVYEEEVNGQTVMAVLSWERLKEQIARYTLRIDNARNLADLSFFASRIRSGVVTSKVNWL